VHRVLELSTGLGCMTLISARPGSYSCEHIRALRGSVLVWLQPAMNFCCNDFILRALPRAHVPKGAGVQSRVLEACALPYVGFIGWYMSGLVLGLHKG
jgi:hypothetical protein